jgi:formylglycine-generating enzyme required for sulfatase activity
MKSIRNRLSSLLCVASSWCISGAALGQVPWYTVLEQAPNPAVVTDAALRLKIVDSGFPWRIQDIGTGIEMLLVPPGTFLMGANPGDNEGWPNESPAHQVTITQPFYLGKTEVTQAQWQAKMGNNPSFYRDYTESAVRPVDTVSWNDVAGFNAATGFRLPTEAEWEFACRAGTTTARYSDGDIGWWGDIYNQYYGGNRPVGGKIPNGYGFYDMLGNVSEWVQDWYGNYSLNSVKDPYGPSSGTERLLRGGSLYNWPIECRSACRSQHNPSGAKGRESGFRVARTVSGFLSISGVIPVSGASIGGTVIKITGTNFPNPPVVTIGGIAAIDVVWVSPTLITAVTPAGTPGMAVVGVSGKSAESFYYRPSCDGDLDNNGTIDSADLSLILLNMGDCASLLTTQQSQEPMIFAMPEAAKPVAVKK